MTPHRILLPVAALAVLAPAVSAHGAVALTKGPFQGGLLMVDGRGTVDATGWVVAYGLLRAPARVHVTGGRGVTVRVTLRTGPGGRRVVTRRGHRVHIPRGTARVIVTGQPARVRLTGRRVALSIAGDGMVRLRGTGGYDLNAGGWTPWDPSRPVMLRVPEERGDDDGDDD
ncbi:MAG TPA: hypothetical protein VNT51_10650 [Miltoncostaeaceae bacterium]|nr:hypothetical protein [Miltoncostaeaceae bacterium]